MDKKAGMSALDFRFLVPELKKALMGGVFRKIYQHGKKQFLFEVFNKVVGEVWLYADESKMFITETREAAAAVPPAFCMFLRKHLLGKRIEDIRQHDFDRIIEIETEDGILIFEMIAPGNVILTDSMRNIIMPLEVQKWKDREVKPKRPYKYPPKMTDPFRLDMDALLRMLKRTDKKAIVFLATSLGFGPVYAAEICERAGIDQQKQGQDLNLDETSRMHSVMASLDRIERKPSVYPDFVSPFPLLVYKDQRPEEAGTFWEALDRHFSEKAFEAEKEEIEKAEEEKKEKIERIEKVQKEAGEKWGKLEKGSRDDAEAIYENYSTVEAALQGIQKAKGQGMTWDEIKERVKSEGTPEADAIKEIREKDGIIVMDLGGNEVEIDIRLSVEENAAKHYEDAKWAKKKLRKLAEAKPAEEIVEEKAPAKKKPAVKRKRKKWHEKFKWFISSDGFLVIAGRNAEQNDMILTKHADSKDVVYHADIPGAAFVVIKAEGKDVPNETMKEAAEFGAANSKAWSRGLGKIDMFCVAREQVSKPGGLPKGSWVVSGERLWFKGLELKQSIGVKMEAGAARVIYGPVMAMRKNSDYFVTIRPGSKKSLELARDIKKALLIKAKPEDKELIEQVLVEDIEKAIPGGLGDIVE
jgi:predicted ribosome quality control (RQC) complex YloA/Tae2 family protein